MSVDPSSSNQSLYNESHCGSSNESQLCSMENVTEVVCRDQEYYSFNYALVGTLFQGIVFIVGVAGNVLVCAVVKRTKSMHSTTNCYLVSLAIADTITLVAGVPQEILSYHILGDQWVWGSFGCTLMIYLQYLGVNLSALSLTAFTIERYLAICHPIRSKSICTISRAKKIIFSCWAFAVIYCSPWLLLTKTRTRCVKGYGEITTCGFRLRRDSTEYLIMFFTDIILFYVLPLVLSVVLYSLIAKILLPSTRSRYLGGICGNETMMCEAAIKSNQSRVQVVKMLAWVVTIFATLWIPYRGLVVYNSLATMYSSKPYMDLWYLMFAKTCIYMNCAINPILYNAMSDKFRKAFRRFLFCGKLNEPLHNHLYCYNLTNNPKPGKRSDPSRLHAHRRRENDSTKSRASHWRISPSKIEDHSPSFGKGTTTSVLLNHVTGENSNKQETQC